MKSTFTDVTKGTLRLVTDFFDPLQKGWKGPQSINEKEAKENPSILEGHQKWREKYLIMKISFKIATLQGEV